MSLHNTTHELTDTLSVALALAKQYGITRSADITEFSQVNLPVWIALRPNAKCLSQSAGKGMCKPAAQISALMEGIEIGCSESVDITYAKYMTIENSHNKSAKCINLSEHPLAPCVSAEHKIPWLETTCLRDGQSWYVPVEMLSLDFTLRGESAEQPRRFRTTSNGLASGRTYTEACVSGLLEVIERHSITLNNMLIGDLKRIEIGNYCPQKLGKVLEELSANDIELSLFESTTVAKVHAIEAFMWSPSGVVPPVHGFGCSLDLEIAILRAILEANQASTLLLSGSRDDLHKQTYLVTADAHKIANTYTKKTKTMRYLLQEDFNNLDITPNEELNLIINHVAEYLDREILAFRYTPPDYPISVCKILIPTFEGYYISGYKPQTKVTNSETMQENIGGLQLAAGGKF